LEARSRMLSLTDKHLRWLGERDDIPQLLAASDVLISCSDNEPFGRVVAEAGAGGIPVVSTDSGGKAEIIEDGVTGLLTPPRDTQLMADACVTLLKDQRRRGKMGAAARKRIELLFDVRRTADELSSLLEGVAVNGS
jgi:L-malate glycosyltransferase